MQNVSLVYSTCNLYICVQYNYYVYKYQIMYLYSTKLSTRTVFLQVQVSTTTQYLCLRFLVLLTGLHPQRTQVSLNKLSGQPTQRVVAVTSCQFQFLLKRLLLSENSSQADQLKLYQISCTFMATQLTQKKLHWPCRKVLFRSILV